LSSLFESTYNPDVLSCIANLSNDEVFTPPELANKMLDMLPQEIWSDPKATFLDPACKSGVFLREIAKRLIEGLADEYPDLQERLDHIYKRQIFGIAITELTSLLSRRSLYCSKYPNSRYSVVRFDNAEGNIRFKNIQHTWRNGRCVWCGAAQQQYDRDSSLEQHAYEFIHIDDPEEVLHMKFDVIIGNPPYQLSDGGAQQSAVPIYQKFIEQAIRLQPRYLTMIVPARWYAGGRGLDSFRRKMLHDTRLSQLHDFPETNDCFPGVNIRGGVCYFLWDRSYDGECTVVNHFQGTTTKDRRYLLSDNGDYFIRWNKGMEIIAKVQSLGEPSFSELVSASKPFGLRAAFKDFEDMPSVHSNIKLYRFGNDGYIQRGQVLKNEDLINRWKVIVPEASPGTDEYPHLVLSKPIISEPGSICTETYLMIGPFDNQAICENACSYIVTRFFRFLVLMLKNTQHTTRRVYQFVPQVDLTHAWNDSQLYKKYRITDEEIAFIESLVKER
jgi:site-specific DNA-methyltransferase (adenine-specific)